MRDGRIAESVAKPWLRQDVFRVRRVPLDFLPEHTDVSSQVFELLSVFDAPHGAKQLNVVKRHVGVLHQVSQKTELGGRKMNLVFRFSQYPVFCIQFEESGAEYRWLASVMYTGPARDGA